MENLFKLNKSENKNNENVENNYEQIILQPFYYFEDLSKLSKLCQALIRLYSDLMKIDQVDIEFYFKFIEPMHTIILITDDIADTSDIRWGIPTAHNIFGVGRTVSMIDYILHSKINEMFGKSNKVGNLMLKNIQKLFQGQTMETYWRDNFICPSEEDYYDMVSKKTGQYFFVMASYMTVFSKNTAVLDVNKLSFISGIYYQISDDYLGLTSKVYCKSKVFCDDIREGKFIFPIIHAIKSRPNDTRILDILKMRTNDIDLKMKCLELLEKFGSMEYTSNKINFFKGLYVQEIEKLGFKKNCQTLFEIESIHKTPQDH